MTLSILCHFHFEHLFNFSIVATKFAKIRVTFLAKFAGLVQLEILPKSRSGSLLDFLTTGNDSRISCLAGTNRYRLGFYHSIEQTQTSLERIST